MYTNKKGFGLSSLIAKIILIALFVLLLIWLFRNYSPNMKPFYNNVFRENISYMKDAAKSYFTNDALPTEVGQTTRLTLKQMEEMKLLIPFVDKDGKACDVNKSYAEITKEEVGYTLKVNLVCGKESNYIIDILGCHDYCNACEVKKDKTALEYEFTRTITKNITELSCPKGYNRKDSICTKKTGTETVNATVHYTKPSTQVADILYTSGENRIIEVASIKKVTSKTEKKYVDRTSITTKQYIDKMPTTRKEYVDPNKKVTENCHDEQIPGCTVQCIWQNGQMICNSCTRKVCADVTSYYCSSGYTKEGSGSNLKCYKNVTTYSCPSGYTEEGSGSNLKCYKNVTTYSCGAGLIQEGTGANTKCYKNVTTETTTYSCPKEATSNNGRTGIYLKCYKKVEGEKVPYCANSNAVIKDGKCVLTIPSQFSHYSCPNDYKLNNSNGTCSKDIIDTIKATSTKKEVKKTETKWSRSKVLEGWTATGKTRTVKVN